MSEGPQPERPTDTSEKESAARVPAPQGESSLARAGREAHRVWLYVASILAAVALVFLVALIVGNTRVVKVSWVFGSSRVSLVWLVLFAAILGFVLGLALGIAIRWRTHRRHSTRAPNAQASDAA